MTIYIRTDGRKVGFVVSEETKYKTKMSNPNRHDVKIPQGEFVSIREASRVTGLNVGTIRYRCKIGEGQRAGTLNITSPKRDWRNWYMDDVYRDRTTRSVRSPLGDFPSVAAAARAHGVSSSAICHAIRKGLDFYWYLDENGEPIEN